MWDSSSLEDLWCDEDMKQELWKENEESTSCKADKVAMTIKLESDRSVRTHVSWRL